MIDEDAEDLRIVRLGIDAESFLASPLGIHLATQARDEIDQATKELVAANPSDVEANTKLRNRIYVASQAIIWIREAAQAGKSAHERIKAQEAQDY